ncbi:MAG TPA: Hpt domain-containing protein [Phycisphaerales bacterium]|nr:Hpt domain-containing protein [Phycisphaerales bacterium]
MNSATNQHENTAQPPLVVPELVDRCMGSASIALLVISKLEEQLRNDGPEMARHARAGDCAGLARLAHAMKGAAGASGAHEVHRRAAELEATARACQLEQAITVLNALGEDVARCLAYLPSARATLQGAGTHGGAQQ